MGFLAESPEVQSVQCGAILVGDLVRAYRRRVPYTSAKIASQVLELMASAEAFSEDETVYLAAVSNLHGKIAYIFFAPSLGWVAGCVVDSRDRHSWGCRTRGM